MLNRLRSLALILTGLVCLLGSDYAAAMYDPGTGRFLQRDPSGYPDGMNSYGAYHVMRGGVDPTGLKIHIRAESGRVESSNANLFPEGASERSMSMAWASIKYSWNEPGEEYHFVRISYDISGSDIIMSDSESVNDPAFRERIENGLPYMQDPAAEKYQVARSWSFLDFPSSMELSVSSGPGHWSGHGNIDEQRREYLNAWRERNVMGKGGIAVLKVEFIYCVCENRPAGDSVDYMQGSTEDFNPVEKTKPNRIRTPREATLTLVSGCSHPDNEMVVDSGDKTLEWAVFGGTWNDNGEFLPSLHLR